MYTAVSLFSGMGGDTLGMKMAGVDVVAYSENDRSAQQSHDANFQGCKLVGNGDILKTTNDEFSEFEGVDFLFAGFPCQSFSSAGQRRVDDPRNTMFREFVRAAKYIKPKVVIGENVKGLITKKTDSGESYLQVILREFENLGYVTTYRVLHAEKYGVSQKRDRLFIIGIDPKSDFTLRFPVGSEEMVGLEDIVSFSMNGAAPVDPSTFDFTTIPNECIVEDLSNNEKGSSPHPYLLMKRDTPDKSYNGKSYSSLFSFAKRVSPIHCEVVDIRKPAKTIICTYGHQPRMFIPIRNSTGDHLRTFTIDELKRIQSFPKDFIVCGDRTNQIKQIGNAVPPLLVKSLIESVK
jgi:DNA (cytosine-5)-methyltransferase 1